MDSTDRGLTGAFGHAPLILNGVFPLSGTTPSDIPNVWTGLNRQNPKRISKQYVVHYGLFGPNGASGGHALPDEQRIPTVAPPKGLELNSKTIRSALRFVLRQDDVY